MHVYLVFKVLNWLARQTPNNKIPVIKQILSLVLNILFIKYDLTQKVRRSKLIIIVLLMKYLEGRVVYYQSQICLSLAILHRYVNVLNLSFNLFQSYDTVHKYSFDCWFHNFNSFSILLFVNELFNTCILICVIVFFLFVMCVIKKQIKKIYKRNRISTMRLYLKLSLTVRLIGLSFKVKKLKVPRRV